MPAAAPNHLAGGPGHNYRRGYLKEMRGYDSRRIVTGGARFFSRGSHPLKRQDAVTSFHRGLIRTSVPVASGVDFLVRGAGSPYTLEDSKDLVCRSK